MPWVSRLMLHPANDHAKPCQRRVHDRFNNSASHETFLNEVGSRCELKTILRGVMADKRANYGSVMHPFETEIDPVSAALQELHSYVAIEELPDDFLKILDEIDAKIAFAKLNSSQ
jgi:hypothetical protein